MRYKSKYNMNQNKCLFVKWKFNFQSLFSFLGGEERESIGNIEWKYFENCHWQMIESNFLYLRKHKAKIKLSIVAKYTEIQWEIQFFDEKQTMRNLREIILTPSHLLHTPSASSQILESISDSFIYLFSCLFIN